MYITYLLNTFSFLLCDISYKFITVVSCLSVYEMLINNTLGGSISCLLITTVI